MRIKPVLLVLLFIHSAAIAQNFTFNFNSTGQRVCLADVSVDTAVPSATLHFRDYQNNTNRTTSVYRRQCNGTGSDWTLVASELTAGTPSWTDTNVTKGETWEYQLRRANVMGDAIGYAAATIASDQSNYRGRMILLIASNIEYELPEKVNTLIKDITGDGWFVYKLSVPKATGWYSGDTVIGIRNQIGAIYLDAPANDKPRVLFILGHVPLPRSGTGGQTPDDHPVNAGARGADTYYADVDGVFTDTSTFNPGGLSTPLAINLPGDFKWDQDFIPSELEMAFGRVDFADITSYNQGETALTGQYLDRLHNYKHIAPGCFMGNRTAFNFGFNNSNDGSYRSLPSISKADSLFQNYSGTNHPQWVNANGPFMVYMQNQFQPAISEWNTYGMNATVFSSDQSYWGFGDVPESYQYSKIRALLAANTKCLIAIWTTMAINIFHQPGAGEPLGSACKQIMNHNIYNQKLEKPFQEYDLPAFWNRTQFAFYGDPTLRLHQVYPAANPVVSCAGNAAVVSWSPSPDSRIIGYHVYKSETELGIFQKISGQIPVTTISFSDTAYVKGCWYMIRAVVLQETGCGFFINPSQGIFIEGDIDIIQPPGAISGNSQVCVSENQTYSINPVPDATYYEWTLPAGWNGTSSGTSITVTTGTSSGFISVVAFNENGYSISSELNITVNPFPEQPGSISGNSNICQSSTQTYMVQEVSGVTYYTWTLPQGWIGSSDSASISILAGVESGLITVAASNLCGISSASEMLVNTNPLPEAAGPVSGSTEVCQGQSSVTYTVPPINFATTYNWNLPSGATASGNFNSIQVSFSDLANSGFISVSGLNDCGYGSESSLFVNINLLPETPSVTQNGIILTSGSPDGNQWYNSAGLIPEATLQNYSVTEDGTYYDIVTLNGCSSAPSIPIEVILTNQAIPEKLIDFVVYPNPVTNFLYIQIPVYTEIVHISIINSNGQIVQKAVLPINPTIDVSKLSAGLYLIVLESGNHLFRSKFTKN